MCLRHPPFRHCRYRPLIGAGSNHQLNWWFMTTGSLCETLENYLKHNCNAKRTAEAMFVHRNTLNYRLKKISELLNCDLEDMNKCLSLKLAFLIMKYRGR